MRQQTERKPLAREAPSCLLDNHASSITANRLSFVGLSLGG